MLKIALIFHSARNDNMGVGALTVSDISILRGIAADQGIDMRMTVIDSYGERPPYAQASDVDITEVRELREFRSIYRIFRGVDMVVDIGGGDSFSDIYGGKRLTRLLLLKYLAILARKPLVLAPQTMGPFASGFWARAARPAINRSAIVTTRDTLSTDYLRKLGIKRNIIEASDVALKLPYDAPNPRDPDGPVRVGLNVSGLLMQGGYTGANQFGLSMDYPSLMRDIITRFQAHPDGCEVHLVPHVISFEPGTTEDDYQASLTLAAEFENVIVAPRFESPSEAKSYIAGLNFFMGARMHACIAAFSSGVPVVPMAYSRKFAGLFGSLGYERTVDCTSEDNEAIQTKIFQAFKQRDLLKEDMAQAYSQGRTKLGAYERAVGDLMTELAQKKVTGAGDHRTDAGSI